MGNDDDVSTLIRPATLADADAIAHVHTVSWRETYGRFVDDPDTSPWFDAGRRVDMWRSTLESPDVREAVQALLDTVLADRPASLWVAADNPRAHAFYRRNGFTPDGAESAFGPIPRTVRLVR
ncbi:GNAT family N-acetyltransferase [Curtobacterium citreum]|uniref:GNAT family N-acetyltransferase n=1 Tax=Curtobacterium citreum TaxID=2036 RepID=UPI00217E132A|nr:GNAT family N-acetyltransferase [Curtobacterium flaccumfaciens]MCS6582511.1 GNAT family N-acetyltransferase [Curtobacterium flaccumfaciens pv. beticola]